jgi:NADH:ubiquinone oxidoreductase subunit C
MCFLQPLGTPALRQGKPSRRKTPNVPSTVSGLYAIADWLEREVFDQYGIFSRATPILNGLLNFKGFEGTPASEKIFRSTKARRFPKVKTCSTK